MTPSYYLIVGPTGLITAVEEYSGQIDPARLFTPAGSRRVRIQGQSEWEALISSIARYKMDENDKLVEKPVISLSVSKPQFVADGGDSAEIEVVGEVENCIVIVNGQTVALDAGARYQIGPTDTPFLEWRIQLRDVRYYAAQADFVVTSVGAA